MAEIIRPWTAEESLADLSLHHDWDYMASMISSLRIYLFEHGAVPTWNFLLCGGRPELAIPSSWVYGWASLFAYLLPPNQAIIAVWIALSVVGFMAAFTLLRDWTGNPLGAFTGAWIYTLSGYYAVRFNVGHVTFAFFHLLPLMMLLFDRALGARLAGRRSLGSLAGLTLVSFLFFTAGLPHGVFYFYPAFLLLALFRLGGLARALGAARCLGAAGVVVLSHGLGLWLAAYRVWPPLRWQLDFPRKGVLPESFSVVRVLRNTVTLVPDYFGPWKSEAWEVYASAGYNAFVGPVPWLLALGALILLRSRGPGPRGASRPGATDCYACLLVLAGVTLALGNHHPWGPGSIFPHLPVLEGVRGFSRYHVLTVFGLAILSACAVAWISERTGRLWRPLGALLALAACGPILVQAALMAWNIEALPRSSALALYPPLPHPDPPELVWTKSGLITLTKPEDRNLLLRRGYWIANCFEDIDIPNALDNGPAGMRRSITTPPPERLVAMTGDSLVLAYAPAGPGATVRLNLPHFPAFRYNASPLAASPPGSVVFRRADPPGGKLTISAHYPGPREGAWATVAGLAATVIFFLWARGGDNRRRAGAGGRKSVPPGLAGGTG